MTDDMMVELTRFEDRYFDEPYYLDATTVDLTNDRERFTKMIEVLDRMSDTLKEDVKAINEELSSR